jgi:hypothetical protein
MGEEEFPFFVFADFIILAIHKKEYFKTILKNRTMKGFNKFWCILLCQ